MKKGQITIYIIIGLILLLIIGAALYFSGRQAEQEFQAAQPRITELPAKIEPVRQAVQSCIQRLGKTAIQRAGIQGGYVEDEGLLANPLIPTEGDAVDFTPFAGPKVAYWWYMKSKNTCQEDCIFSSMRPPLTREDGFGSIELQIDEFVNSNLAECMESTEIAGCDIREISEPEIRTNIAETNVFFDGTYRLQATCEDQTATIEEYYVRMPVRLKELYMMGSEIIQFQEQYNFLEQATTTILTTYSARDSQALPPFRAIEFGGPSPGEFWIRYEVADKIQNYLAAYIPVMQIFGSNNYDPIIAKPGIPDKDLYEQIYNKEFMIVLNSTYPAIDSRLAYYDLWEPYFDLNCNGELCRADTGTNFFVFPFSIHRYEFAYDLSYPVLVELRDPHAFNGEGYVFQFFIEQNMRNSKAFTSDSNITKLLTGQQIPSMFCNPEQRTSEVMQLYVKDRDTYLGLDNVSVSYVCGENNCNMGMTEKGILKTRLPRCINGQVLLTKPFYMTQTFEFDSTEGGKNITKVMEPMRKVNARIKNYVLLKPSKYDDWAYVQARGVTSPKPTQETVIMLQKETKPWEMAYGSVVKLEGARPGILEIVPGNYTIQIISLARDKNLTIPVDTRCEEFQKMPMQKEKECYDVPQDPIVFNATKPFPLGSTTFEYEFTSNMLQQAHSIEFRQFIIGFQDLKPENRIAEDMAGLDKVQFYTEAQPSLLKPVIS